MKDDEVPRMYSSPENDLDGLRYVARLVEVISREGEVRNWSSLRLAQEAKVHHSLLARAENGKRIPGVQGLVRLSRALGIRLSEICRRAEGME